LKDKKQLWILAGGNGAGKSTFHHRYLELEGTPFINADILAQQLYPDAPEQYSYDAAIVATQLRTQLLHDGRSFCFETVFSHSSKIDFIAQAKTLGYEIIFVFIHLENNSLNQARVSQRVAAGGHDVPVEKIISRLPRVLINVRKVIPLCSQVYVLDNSRTDNPFKQVVIIQNARLNILSAPLPEWASELLVDYLG